MSGVTVYMHVHIYLYRDVAMLLSLHSIGTLLCIILQALSLNLNCQNVMLIIISIHFYLL